MIYQKGDVNRADFMSRHATKLSNVPGEWVEEAQELEKTIWFLNYSPYSEAVSLPKIIQETQKDKTLSKLITCLKKGFVPKQHQEELKPYKKIWDSITIL